ncbi:MAG TPA: ribonuclease Z [Gaiellaceae bacterium]|nr:ribonuclease Z [Gaiellaceae bacterium]
MDLDRVLLGTSGSVPTARRGPASILVRRGGEKLLVDCGEGAQRQLLRSSVGLVELSEVFLTHYHADHYLGLPGMLKTFALRGRELPMTIYGPPGLNELFGSLQRVFGRLTFPLRLVELRPGDALDRGDYRIVVFKVHHGVTAQGYALVEEPRAGRFDVEAAKALGVPDGPLFGVLQRGEAVEIAGGGAVRSEQVVGPPRPGRKVVITGDTRPARSVLEIANEAEVLVHDATFSEEERERADETGHSTAAQAAELARVAAVRLLVLTHLSNRYFGPEIAREARAIFPETVVPRDFDIIDVGFPERGGPQLIKGGAVGSGEEAETHGEHGAGGGGGRPHGGGGDPDDPALRGDPVGARTRGHASPDGARGRATEGAGP